MGPVERDLWIRWEDAIRTRIHDLPRGHEFEIKDLFQEEWEVEIVGGQRNAFGSMFQKVLQEPDVYGVFDEIEHLGVRENQDNHEIYRRL